MSSPAQLELDLDLEAPARLADRLRGRQRLSDAGPGAERLLIALIRRGLDERALAAAVALALELDSPPGADDDRRPPA